MRCAASTYWKLERLTVQEELRDCTTAHVQPDRMAEAVAQLAEAGLCFVPIQRVGAYQGFAHSHPPVVDGRPWSWYGVVAKRPEAAAEFVRASASGDHGTIGRLLGYPECCCRFFRDVWMSGYVDPVWQEAIATGGARIGDDRRTVDIPSETSIAFTGLRYIGLRIAAHLPCAFDCAETLDICQGWIDLAEELGIKGIDELLELLDMPVEWDCLKGVAWVSTPIVRIVTNSMTCYPNFIVRKAGGFIPEHAARGLRFPYLREPVTIQ